MNSAYGKTIQKEIKEKFVYKRDVEVMKKTKKGEKRMINEYEWYSSRHYNSIKENTQIANSNIHKLRVIKPINNDFNFGLFGVQVLSMSKRIMNEVMCLGYDLKCRIYYQDTDSCHVEADDLNKLEVAYEEKYKRQLRGNQLGQFHSDFPTINGRDEIPVSIHSIFLPKKIYIDELHDSSGEIDYMIRGKGLTQA